MVVAELAIEGGAHTATVCRISWNVTGTALATADVTGRVLLWSRRQNVWFSEEVPMEVSAEL